MKLFEQKFRVRVKKINDKDYGDHCYVVQYSEISVLGFPLWETLDAWYDWGHPDKKTILKRAGFRDMMFTVDTAEKLAAEIRSPIHIRMIQRQEDLKAEAWLEEEKRLKKAKQPYKIKDFIS